MAINVALYGRRGARWAMTERTALALDRGVDHFRVGPSSLSWQGDSLVIEIDEIAVPIPKRLRGQVRVFPTALAETAFVLDPNARHRWRPIAPLARVEAAFSHPALNWTGRGYVDSNAGSESLEEGFSHWHWSRADLEDGCALLYEPTARDGSSRVVAVRYGANGRHEQFDAPAEVGLPRTLWGIDRATRSQGEARVVQTLLDTPFYARSVVETQLLGATGAGVHESLDLERFSSRWVKLLLPWRMPRRTF